MTPTIEFWKTLLAHLEAGEKVFLALVAENTPHSPGTRGARMLLAEGGESLGTVGGGIMEHKLKRRAAEILKQDARLPEIQVLHHQRSADGERSGMICAGSQTNLYAVLEPAVDLETVRRGIALLESGRSGSLVIDPRGMAVEELGPDLGRPQIFLERAGESWRFEEQLLNRKRVAILGGGHCGLALARAMGRLGFDVEVFETRENVFEGQPTGIARPVRIVRDFQQAGGLVEYPELTFAVVMTTDFPSDVRALTGVLPRPFRFIGVMGSSAKIAEIGKRLTEEGFTARQLERLCAPIGLAIGSNTPEEIAVSVAAQILKLHRESTRS